MRRIKIVELNLEFDSIQEAATFLDGDYRNIRKALTGERETYRGYTFEYIGYGARVLEAVSGRVWDSVAEAAEDLDLLPSSIYRVLRNDRSRLGKYVFRYVK